MSMSATQPGEDTPLLRKAANPLPKFQLLILLWVQLAEPISSMVIYPFINKLIAELPITGGDEAKVGYYAGLIESLFFVTEAFTVLQWSRYSDRVGRKPIILTGLFGLSLSMISFGLSKSFWALVVSRCLAGLLNGNVGVLKSMMGELTDSSNIAQGMGLMPVVWNTGATIGPIIGGWLYDPYTNFPTTFGRFEFWKTYPHALPCFVVSGYCIFSFFLALICLNETVKFESPDSSDLRGQESPSTTRPKPGHLSIREVLTPRVMTAMTNYALLAFLDITLRAIQPLFYTSKIRYGGLGFPPAVVGICLGAFGLFSGLYQAFVFPSVYDRFGTKNVFVTSLLTFVPMFTLFPLMNLSAQRNGVDVITWIELTLQIILYVIMDMGFSCALIYVRSAAPNTRSIGATNGLAQTSVSVVRFIGPVTANSLYALSVQKNLIGGSFVYIFLIVVSILSLYGTTYLPKRLWKAEEEEEL